MDVAGLRAIFSSRIRKLRAICEKYKVSAVYLLELMPDTNHAVSDICLETGLYPKSARRLGMLQRLKELKFESFDTVIEHFIDETRKRR